MKLLPYLLIIPLLTAFMIPLISRKLGYADKILAVLGTLALGIVSFALAYYVLPADMLVYKVGGWMPPAGISLTADNLSAYLLVTVNLVAFLAAVYSAGYVKRYTDTWKFYSLFMLMVSGINGVLISSDIFSMYVFLEIAAISGYFLVAFGSGPEELEAAFKYAVMGTVASIFILMGIALLYGYTSTLNMADMAAVLSAKAPVNIMSFVSVLFLMGFSLKAALAPFHAWLPYAHSSAPAPISAMLSGVSIKILGVYALVRIFFNVFGLSTQVSYVLIALGVLSMFIGSILAFGQSDMKRLFAYSSIGQIGFITLGFGIATPLSVLGALFYIFNHSIAKALLFLNSGSIEDITGTRDLGSIRGVISSSPVLGYTSLAGSLSICGIPPFGGFWCKLIIIIAAVEAHRPVLAAIAALVSALTLAYYSSRLTPALFTHSKMANPQERVSAIPKAMALPVVILAALCMLSAAALLPGPANDLLKKASSVLTGGKDYVGMFTKALK